MRDVDDPDQLYAAHLTARQGLADRALAAVGCDALVVSAGELKYRYLDDSSHPFTVNPHFKAWVPVLDAPGSFLVHRPGRRLTLLFHQPEDYWHKPPTLPIGGWLGHLDVEVLRSPIEARGHVPAGSAYVGESFQGSDQWGFKASNPPLLLDMLHYARAVKTPYELACMRRAAAIGARAHRAAARAFADGACEYEIHLAYLAASGHQEAELPYANIIAINEGAAILHYTELKRSSPDVRHSFLIDAGGQFRGYASDITRTYAAATGPFSELVAGLDALQQQLCRMVLPGTSYPDIQIAAHCLIGALLKEQGIVRCSTQAAVETGVTSVFFPHGIGHLLGLQVHDIGGHQAAERGGLLPAPAGHPYLRLTRRLEAGCVVTIEPGIYFIDLLLRRAQADGRGRHIDWDTVASLMPFGGARIEDDVVATATGPENLTRAAFAARDA